jgi:hypothetical protein
MKKIIINPAFEDEIEKALHDIWNNRDNISYDNLKFLKTLGYKIEKPKNKS